MSFLLEPRPIAENEVQVLIAALNRTEMPPPHRIDSEFIYSLTVYSKCDCGCGSIGFIPENEEAPTTTKLVADVVAYYDKESWVGVHVYAAGNKIVELEVHSPISQPASLPKATDITAWPIDP